MLLFFSHYQPFFGKECISMLGEFFMTTQSNKPFLQMFEETIIHARKNFSTTYDEEQNLNVVLTPGGGKTPAIEWNGIVGTETETRAAPESSDDNKMACKFAETTTFDQEESNDDALPNLTLFTETVTAGKSESTDSDNPHNVLLWVETATKIYDEETDSDNIENK